MNLGSSSDVCWHSSRELYRFHCCHWGCWEPVSLCLGFRFALLPPSASFPWQGTALHILPISLSSTLLNHIGSVRHQFVVDPSPTHPLFCGGLPHNFMRFALFFSFLLEFFWSYFGSGSLNYRLVQLFPCPAILSPTSESRPASDSICVTATNIILPESAKCFPHFILIFLSKGSLNRRRYQIFKFKEDKNSRSPFIW